MKRRMLCRKLRIFMCLVLSVTQFAYVGDAVSGETVVSNQEVEGTVSSSEYEVIDISESVTEDASTGILYNIDSEITAAYEETTD